MSAPPPIEVRPVRLTRVCWAVAAVVMVVFISVALALGAVTSGPEKWRLPDQIAMVTLGALIATPVLGFTRSRVRADQHGVRIRNVLGDKLVPWQVVRGVRMDDGASWATLDLQDDDTVALLAIQSNDGERAVDAVLALRALLAASRQGPRT